VEWSSGTKRDTRWSNRKTGEGLRYTVADDWLPKVIEWNKTLDPAERFDAAMKAQGLFEVAPAAAP
jgi:hypothetical protein